GRRVPLQGLFYSPAMVPLSKLKEDLGSMKAHHVNAVAITEFPTADFLNLCDQYGLYVLAHSGIHTPYLQNCPHNFVANNPLFRELLLDRMEGFVAQTVHPCVVARCVGSNVGEGSNIKFALETLQQLDPACFAYCEDTFPLEVGSVAGEWTALTPTLEELKQAFCPIGAELTDGAAGEVTLTNKNAFTYFSKFECEYEVSRYGKVVERGHGGIFSLPPTVTQTVQLPYHLPSEGECALRLIFKYFGDTPYAKSGEVAGQFSFLLPVSAKRVNTPVNLPLPELREQENQWHIYAGGCHYTFSTLLGDFTQMDYHNHPIFAQELCQGEWLLRCKETEYSVEENCIIVTASYRVGKQGFPPAGELIRRFTFYGDGCVTVEQGADPQSLYLPILWQVSERFQTLHYYGFGPAGTPREELGTSYMGHFSLDVENQSLDNAQGKLFRLTTKGGFGLAVWNNKQSLNFSAHCKEDKNQIFLAMTPSFTIKLVDEGEDVWQYYNNTYQPIN
ncbi:MAG: DUF4981 domain-containing protein, partial [Clostridia bacterium]|nr:DUF4981 domain-containing protein [Clostridia bacterium]